MGLSQKNQRATDRKRRVVALAGNPNVGKSTLFNSLTGMRQHTGNWPGKTVASARGYCTSPRGTYELVDLPGTYSLLAHSAEEEIARDFLCFDTPDAVVVVCDATCLERNLNLVLQTIELCPTVIVCVNLMDEARRKGIHINLSALSRQLGVPVVGTVARKRSSLSALLRLVDEAVEENSAAKALSVRYPPEIEGAISLIQPFAAQLYDISSRWLSLRLLEGDSSFIAAINRHLGRDIEQDRQLAPVLRLARQALTQSGFSPDRLKDAIVSALVHTGTELCREVVTTSKSAYNGLDRRLDRILTSRSTGYPVMVLLLGFIFWLTMVGANYPSQALSSVLFRVQDLLTACFQTLHAPAWLHGVLVLGIYRVLAWVVSVMLPPMAIFFPLFTLLEDAGYLPRVAYNLDKSFQRCRACGKQALTMCMGFGCNAAGAVGCRIIDSPRERLLAILTNSLVPCNGRIPVLVTVLTMFFVGSAGDWRTSLRAALLLTGLILLGITATFVVTRLLSGTVLKGVPSSFTLELPPYRSPRILPVIATSLLDRTLFVLGRAAAVAAPAGAVIWLLANVSVGQVSLLTHCAEFLDPFARLMGLDGVILLAFLLGFPANEIVIPIMVMAYLSQGTLISLSGAAELKPLLLAHGWTWNTAASTLLFSLFHWPCSTTLLTIHRETGSWRWTALAAAIPTALGVIVCMLLTGLVRLVS